MIPFCCLCGNTNPADLGQVIGICLDAGACRARQARSMERALWGPLRMQAARYGERQKAARADEEAGRRQWVRDVKERLGLVCAGDD